jgi:hypothetical protein
VPPECRVLELNEDDNRSASITIAIPDFLTEVD